MTSVPCKIAHGAIWTCSCSDNVTRAQKETSLTMQSISVTWWKVCSSDKLIIVQSLQKSLFCQTHSLGPVSENACIGKQNLQSLVQPLCSAQQENEVSNIYPPHPPILIWTLSFQHTLNLWMEMFLSFHLFMFSSTNGTFFFGPKNQLTKTCYNLEGVCLVDLILFFFPYRIWQVEHLKQTWTRWTWRKGWITTTLTKNQGKAVILKLCYPLCICV